MNTELSVFEQWMVKSNVEQIKAESLDVAKIVALLRANGYNRVANGVEAAFPKPPPRSSEMNTARVMLQILYLDWVNNFISVSRFAEHHGLTGDQGAALIKLAKSVAESNHPEA